MFLTPPGPSPPPKAAFSVVQTIFAWQHRRKEQPFRAFGIVGPPVTAVDACSFFQLSRNETEIFHGKPYVGMDPVPHGVMERKKTCDGPAYGPQPKREMVKCTHEGSERI